MGRPGTRASPARLFGGLLFLMGIAPLSAWGHSTLKTFGRAIWKPFLVSLVVLALVICCRRLQPVRPCWPSGCAPLSAAITLYEYGRAVWARHRATEENLPLALWRLAGKNRRRYGGYIIHLGVVLMALGVIGINMFQTETQATVPAGGSINLCRLYRHL